jgi:Spy/CpxP family protein refolding chaperone
MSDTHQATGGSGRHRRWFWMGGWAFAGLAVLAAMAVPRVWAYRGLSGGGPGGGHRFGAQMMHDPAAVKQHAGMALEWLLRGVSASDEQKQRAKRISDGLIDELVPSAERHRQHREAIARELAKPQIDRAAIERLRKEELALADDASRKVSTAVADLAEVLTPEQRAEILDLVQRFHGAEPPPLG